MNYQIITDSCCDFPTPMYETLGLSFVPLSVEFRGETNDDRNDDSLKEMYDGLRSGQAAKTSAVNPSRWGEVIEPALSAGQDVLVLAFSSGLSTTYQSAVIAAEELGEKYPERTIRVVDTLCASMGQGLLVWYACKKRDEGLSLEELYSWVMENRLHLCHWFTVDDLNHLKRGGRISAATALFGTMLSIKPVMHVDDGGHLTPVSKARGRKASLLALVDQMEKNAVDSAHGPVFISHGDCEGDALLVADEVVRRFGNNDIHLNYVGPVIGNHSGPGTVALFFVGHKR